MAQPAHNTDNNPAPQAVRFGPFDLSMDTGELRKHGVRVRLQHRPFQILAALLDRPGRLVTREELRSRLWASDVFVDFESGLNTAVNRLRLALGDSADNPVYIETLARLGYRFLAPVEIVYPNAEPTPVKDESSGVPQPADLVRVEPPSDLSRARSHLGRVSVWGMGIVLALALTAAGLLVRYERREPAFQQLTFRKGFVGNARFAPDGKHIIYSAEWNGAPSRLFSVGIDGRESRDLNMPDASLTAAASPSPDAGILVQRMRGETRRLESVSRDGNPARVIGERIRNADWGPDGKLCLVRAKGSTFIVEYPAGHIVYQSSEWISDVRVSPDGSQVAFAEHPILHDDMGHVAVVDATTGKSRVLGPAWESLDGLAWHPSDHEIWFTAARSGFEKTLMAVAPDGRPRQVAQIPGGIELRDIAQSGKVLVTRSNEHMAMMSGNLPEGPQQNISWLDWSRPVAISADGTTILFDESGAGGGTGYSAFVYRRGSPSPVRIGSGRAMDLSDDGRWALAQDAFDPAKLSLLSVENRTVQAIAGHGFIYHWTKFLPDARQILAGGNFPGQQPGVYRQQLPDGAPSLIRSGLEFDDVVIDPAGRFATGVSEKCEITILDLKDGQTRTIKTAKSLYPVVFMDANQTLMRSIENKAVMLDVLDLKSGKLTSFQRIQPADAIGVAGIFPIHVAKNLRDYVYSLHQSYSDLFIVSGLR